MATKPVTRAQARTKMAGGKGLATKLAARAGALGVAATAGYAVGKAINKKTGLSDKLANAALAVRNKVKGVDTSLNKPKKKTKQSGMSMRDMQIKKALKDMGVE